MHTLLKILKKPNMAHEIMQYLGIYREMQIHNITSAREIYDISFVRTTVIDYSSSHGCSSYNSDYTKMYLINIYCFSLTTPFY